MSMHPCVVGVGMIYECAHAHVWKGRAGQGGGAVGRAGGTRSALCTRSLSALPHPPKVTLHCKEGRHAAHTPWVVSSKQARIALR